MAQAPEDQAAQVAQAIEAGAPFALLPPLDLDAAYVVQDALTRRRLGAAGMAGLAGYKLAFNSPAAMAHNGLHEPCIAPLYRQDIRQDGATLRQAGFRALVVEPEIALELGADLTGERPDRSAAMAALRGFRPAIEVMDHRGAFALAPSAAQAVAQGIFTAGAVLGPLVAPSRLAERHGMETALWLDERCIGRALDAAPQDPLDGLVWAARALAARGWPLTAGMILLCGTHLPVQAVNEPASVRATIGDFGSVGFSLV
ncbi:MAG: 2-keto-4-pentenoate hydratase [Gemmobacter sp.]